MHGFIFDFGGTLDRLPDPVGFLKALRVKHPGSKIFLYTGTQVSDIKAMCPGIMELVDAWVAKPEVVKIMLGTLGFPLTSVVYSDDDFLLGKAVVRMYRPVPCEIVHPQDLLRLIEPACETPSS